MLDQVLVLLSPSLLIAAAFGFETHWRYLLLGNLFALVASIQVAMRTMPSAWSSLKGLPITDISANCAYAIFGFSMLVSVREWPLEGSSTVQAAIRSCVILSVAILVFRLGDRLQSVISKDTARILAVYAAIVCIVTQSELRNAASASVVCLAIVVWSAVAVAIYLSSRDLGHLQYGAWQSVFSGKALVRR